MKVIAPADVHLVCVARKVRKGEVVEVSEADGENLVAQGWQAATDGPDGTSVKAIVDWVGDDPVRAAQELAAEQARSKPRSKLIEHLTALTTDSEV